MCEVAVEMETETGYLETGAGGEHRRRTVRLIEARNRQTTPTLRSRAPSRLRPNFLRVYALPGRDTRRVGEAVEAGMSTSFPSTNLSLIFVKNLAIIKFVTS